MESSGKALPQNETLTEKAEVRIDRRGRLYVEGRDLWRSEAFRARLKEMAQLAENSPPKKPDGAG